MWSWSKQVFLPVQSNCWRIVYCYKGVSLLCDMNDIAIWSDMDHFSSNYEIFTLRYENLYFAIWESLFCDMKLVLDKFKTEIFTLQYEKIHFAIWDTNYKTPKNVFCDMGHKFWNSKIILSYQNVKQFTHLCQNSLQCQLYEAKLFSDRNMFIFW